jgi:hypothetical protein
VRVYEQGKKREQSEQDQFVDMASHETSPWKKGPRERLRGPSHAQRTVEPVQ